MSMDSELCALQCKCRQVTQSLNKAMLLLCEATTYANSMVEGEGREDPANCIKYILEAIDASNVALNDAIAIRQAYERNHVELFDALCNYSESEHTRALNRLAKDAGITSNGG